MNRPQSASDSLAFCHDILPQVSRTFALTIPQLPEPLLDEVCVAYLLCRVADTIEDHESMPSDLRKRLFHLFQRLAVDPLDEGAWADFRSAWPGASSKHEDRLVRNLPVVLEAYRNLDAESRSHIETCLIEMSEGMAQYGDRGSVENPVFLCRDGNQLEDYCHYVAGTVGQLLTRLFHRFLSGRAAPPAEVLERGRRFGLALQMTNILRDHGKDLTRGLAFLPPGSLRKEGAGWRIVPAEAQMLFLRVVDHLDEAQRYTLWIPASHRGLRLFCLWALHLALRTLHLGVTPGESRAKVSHAELAEIVRRAEDAAGDDIALANLYREYRSGLVDLVHRLGLTERMRVSPFAS